MLHFFPLFSIENAYFDLHFGAQHPNVGRNKQQMKNKPFFLGLKILTFQLGLVRDDYVHKTLLMMQFLDKETLPINKQKSLQMNQKIQ